MIYICIIIFTHFLLSSLSPHMYTLKEKICVILFKKFWPTQHLRNVDGTKRSYSLLRANVERELVNKWSSLVHPFGVIGFEGGYWIKMTFIMFKNLYKTKKHTKFVLMYNFCDLVQLQTRVSVYIDWLWGCKKFTVRNTSCVSVCCLLFVDSHKVFWRIVVYRQIFFGVNLYFNSYYVFLKNIKQVELLGRVSSMILLQHRNSILSHYENRLKVEVLLMQCNNINLYFKNYSHWIITS